MKFSSFAAMVLSAFALNVGAIAQAQNAPLLPDAFELVMASQKDSRAGATYARIVPGAPIILILQGSGCDSVWRVSDDTIRGTAAQDLIARLAPEATVAVVDKPGVSIGDQKECGASFTLEAWTETLDRSMEALREASGYEGPIATLGISEGAVTAARLARTRPDIGHVAFISAAGCVLIDDMLANASSQALQAKKDRVGVQDRVDQAMRTAEKTAEMIFAEDTPMNTRVWGHPLT